VDGIIWGMQNTHTDRQTDAEVVAIGGKTVNDGGCGPMSGYCTPDPDKVLVGEWECKHNGIKRVQTWDNGKTAYVKIHDHSSGYPTKVGEKSYVSWYA
jgi:hypothetical protein